MRVLVLDEWIPYPLISGKRLRSYHLLTRAARDHDMTYLCFADPVAEEDSLKHMKSLGVKMVTLPRKDPFTPTYRLYALAAANVLFPRPLVMRKHFRQDYLSRLQELLRAQKFDLIHCEWTHYGAYTRLVTGYPLFLSSHNIEAMPWERLYIHQRNRLKRLALYIEWKKMEAFERDVCRSFHHVSAVSEDDRRKFINTYGCESVAVIPNGVDVSYYDVALPKVGGPPHKDWLPGQDRPARDRRGPDQSRPPQQTGHAHEQPHSDTSERTLVFSASFDAFVNQDAVLYWMETIWPRVLRELPGAKMLFLGKDPPPSLTRHASERVQFTGTVPDVRPYLSQSSACVVPLRVAGGSRIKILEAMAAGLPVVSTPEGAEGLDVVPGEHLLIARNVDEFVGGVVRLLQDGALARSLATRGRKLVEERYDWRNIAPLIPVAWQETIRRFKEGQGKPQVQVTSLR